MNKNTLEKSKIFYKIIILLNVFYWYCFRFIVLYCFILFYSFNVFLFFCLLFFSFVVVYRGVPVRAPTGLLRFNQIMVMVVVMMISNPFVPTWKSLTQNINPCFDTLATPRALVAPCWTNNETQKPSKTHPTSTHYFAGYQWKLSLREEVALAVRSEDKDCLRVGARGWRCGVDVRGGYRKITINVWYSIFQ